MNEKPSSERLDAKSVKEPEDVHPGRWLVENLGGLGQIELPPRGDDREIPFADWAQDFEPRRVVPVNFVSDPTELCK
jgi:hypothetical protein